MIQSVQAKQDAKGFDVFISYSTRNKLTADAMKQYLQAKGIRCWKAPDDIIHGESWAKAIPIAIRMARIMVLIWTKDSMSSGQVVNELTLASRANKLVIPFRTESIEPEDEFEYYLAKTHWLDAFGDNLNDHFDLLYRRIEVNLLSELSADEFSLRQGGATDVSEDLNEVSQQQHADVLADHIDDACPDVILPEAESVDQLMLKDPILLIRLTKTFSPSMTELELYEATRGNWAIRMERAQNARYAYALNRGEIIQVYNVESWSETEEISGYGDPRICFTGSACLDRKHHIGRSLAHYFKRGEASPVKFLNCDFNVFGSKQRSKERNAAV